MLCQASSSHSFCLLRKGEVAKKFVREFSGFVLPADEKEKVHAHMIPHVVIDLSGILGKIPGECEWKVGETHSG